MYYDEEKLSDFKNIVLTDIESKIKNIEEETRKLEEVELKAAREKTLDEIFTYMQKKIKDIKSKYKYSINKEKYEKKIKILQFRKSLTENIKKSCEEKIYNYTKEKEYEKYILENIKKTIEKYSIKNAYVLVRKEDLKIERNILNIENVEKIDSDKYNHLGGFKILDNEKNIEIDETFETALKNEMIKFNETYDLNIKNY